MVDNKTLNKVIVFSLIGLLFIAAIFILWPILIAIFVGAIFSYILRPVYLKIKTKINNENLATFAFLFLVILLISIPAWFFLPVLIKEMIDSYMYIQQADLPSSIGTLVGLFLSDEAARVVAVQVNLFVAKFFSFSLDAFSNAFSNLPNILFQLAISILSFFFITRDGDKIKKYLSELSPLSNSTEEKFASAFRGITNAIVFGQLFTGLIQGLALGLGLWILGVPKVFFLTVVATILSIIPMIGAWLVWVPVSLYLLVSGQTLNGTILFLYGLLFVSTIDNFLRPYFISRQTNLNLFVAIIGTIGGLYSFGFIGLILGPLILSYLFIVIEFYKEGKLNELFRE